MCCSLEYKEGPRTIVINGFYSVNQALKHAEDNKIDNFLLTVEKDQA